MMKKSCIVLLTYSGQSVVSSDWSIIFCNIIMASDWSVILSNTFLASDWSIIFSYSFLASDWSVMTSFYFCNIFLYFEWPFY